MTFTDVGIVRRRPSVLRSPDHANLECLPAFSGHVDHDIASATVFQKHFVKTSRHEAKRLGARAPVVHELAFMPLGATALICRSKRKLHHSYSPQD
ncbi:MAG TPA: hypothetical protein VGO55_09185 [Allosphingosinicella sp.]|jgi:hypothetical protein|nr:hypothetical protein [Allosphingosinicella sp.]